MYDPSILGLDLSLTETGIYISNWKETNPVSEVLKPPKSLNKFTRLAWYESQFEEFKSRYNVSYCAVEGYAMGIRTGMVFNIGEQGGIARMVLQKGFIETIIVPPTTLKRFVTGKGNSKKNEMMLGVFKKWGKEFSNDNKADAYALYQFARMYFFKEKLTKLEEDLVKKVDEIEYAQNKNSG